MAATQTPQEIDTELARLYGEAQKLTGKSFRNAERCFRIAGFKKIGIGPRAYWPRRVSEMLADCKALAERDDSRSLTHGVTPSQALREYEETQTELAGVQVRSRELDAIWHRQRWNRYILCNSANGHIHNYTGCHTLRATSLLTWYPELSDKPVDEAVAELGPILCTHCFPTAPAEYKRDAAEYRREQRAAELARKAAAKAEAAAEKARKAEERAAKAAAKPVKVTARDRRNAALQEISRRYSTEAELEARGRDGLAVDILELLKLGKTDAWNRAITNWAREVRNEENGLAWAWFQFGIYAGYAA